MLHPAPARRRHQQVIGHALTALGLVIAIAAITLGARLYGTTWTPGDERPALLLAAAAATLLASATITHLTTPRPPAIRRPLPAANPRHAAPRHRTHRAR